MRCSAWPRPATRRRRARWLGRKRCAAPARLRAKLLSTTRPAADWPCRRSTASPRSSVTRARSNARSANFRARRCTHLLAICGVRPIVAAKILGETHGISRFRSAAAYAAHTGTAPVTASSGRVRRHRLNRGGNRQLNRALYTIAMVQARWDPAARAYLERKLAEGKSATEARRCLNAATSPMSSTAPSSPTPNHSP